MITRDIEALLKERATQYPVVTLIGPRQSGKSTVCRKTFPGHQYVNLEDLALRDFARSDPKGFLMQYSGGVIIDEIQRVPDLTSQIQVLVDEQDSPGQFILTGSHNFRLRKVVNQSLAGRTALLTLLPVTLRELEAFGASHTINDILHSGFYPRIFDKQLDPSVVLSDYIGTYIERDVRELENIRDLHLFQKFLGLCAGRVGQLLNLSNMSNEVGVTSTTLKSWLSILEASFVVHLLQPHHHNVNKRLVKRPKLYFYDVGLAACLLGIRSPEQLTNHPMRGALFENMVIMELMKQNYNAGLLYPMRFYRDRRGHEIDLLIDRSDNILPIEIKSAATFSSHFLKNLDMFAASAPETIREMWVVYGGEEKQQRSSATAWPYTQMKLR